MEELISIVVPVYNVEPYLRKCIESIIQQTYKNIEILLIDDGSKDNSGKICDDFAKEDARIKVIHKKNGGLSDARNVGIDNAKGEYITFIDSDDYISSGYIKYLYNLLVAYNADISICEFEYITESGKRLNHVQDNNNISLFDKRNALYELLDSKLFSNSAWAKLYKTSLFDNIRYPVGKLYEDVDTTYRVFMRSNKIVFGAQIHYYYLYRIGAISKQKFTEQRMDAIYFAETMVDKITEQYPDLIKIGKCRLFDFYITILKMLDSNKSSDYYKKIKIKLKQVRKTVLFYRQSGFKRKFEVIKSYIIIR